MADARFQPKEEVVIPLALTAAGTVEPATLIRSTLLAASLMTLRSRGHFDRYLTKLPLPFHDPVLNSIAGSWLPIEVGVAHYRAANALALPLEELHEIGRIVAARIQDSLLGTLVRVARTAGVTPWTGIEYLPKLWARTISGGAIAVYRLGPKEARVECHGAPELAAIDYFRQAFRGMFMGSGMLFCDRLYIHDLSRYTARGIVGFRVAWA